MASTYYNSQSRMSPAPSQNLGYGPSSYGNMSGPKGSSPSVSTGDAQGVYYQPNAMGPSMPAPSGVTQAQANGFGLAMQYGGPDLLKSLATFYRLQDTPDRTGEQTGLAKQALNIGANADLARNAIAMRALGLDRESLGFDLNDINREGQGYGIDLNDILNARGQMREEQGFTNRGYDLAAQLLGLQRQGIENDFTQQKRGAESDATARGAYTAPGLGRDVENLMGNRSRALGANDTQLAQAGLSRDEALSKLELGLSNNASDKGRNDLAMGGLEDKRGRVALKGKSLDLEAEKLGIDANEYRAKLNNGLAQLGLSGQINADLLAEKKAGAVGPVLDNARKITELALQLGGQYGSYVQGRGGG